MAADGEKSLRLDKVDNCQQMLSLNEMFHLVGDRLTPKEVVCLRRKGLSGKGIQSCTDNAAVNEVQKCDNNTNNSSRSHRSSPQQHRTGVAGSSDPHQQTSSRPRLPDETAPKSLMKKVNDGYDYFLALERAGMVDGTNFGKILQALAITGRQDLLPYVTLRRRKTVTPDPVDEYLEETSRIGHKRAQNAEQCSTSKTDLTTPCSTNKKQKRCRGGRRSRLRSSQEKTTDKTQDSDDIKKKVTCDIRLRVRAEYCHHENVLEGNVFSNKPELLERQFEKFAQANTILKSRDLGSIICDIKFSELTYLDAFWRDYINGSLLEALKGVFITESLKQAVGHEAIKLLVNVDEDDYEAGRLKLLQNLQD